MAARFSLRHSVLAGYALAILVLAAGWIAYRSAGRAVAAHVNLRHTYALAAAVRTVDDAVREAESSQRGFLLTRDDQYLGPYHNAIQSARDGMTRLRSVAGRFPDLMPRVDSLGYFVGLKVAELDQTIRVRRDAGMTAAVAIVRADRSAESMRQIERLLDSVGAAVERIMAGSEAQARAERQLVIVAAIAGAVLAVVLGLLIHVLYARNRREQWRTTQELEAQSYQLQLQAVELETTNSDLETATRELVQHTVEAEFNETRLAGILGSATDAIVSFDDDHKIVYFNAAAERLFGEPAESLQGAPVARFLAERSVQAFEDRLMAARRAAHSGSASPEVWDTIVERRDGVEVPVEVSMAYARSWKQGLFTAVLRDVSRQRQLEDEFRQAQKMEAVGRLAGGIAHDFNNLLTVIGTSSDFLLQDINSDSKDLVQDITEIRRATDRAASLTRQLLAFSRRQLVQPQLLDLNSVVSEMETMLQRLIGEDVTLATEYADDPGLIRVDRGQLEQIVVNLVVNARDAMPGGGVVHLRTDNERRVTPEDGLHAGHARDYVTLAVSDTGVGMDEGTRTRIFEPFFTTKEQGKGTGLGLATVYGIVKQSGGDVVVTSELEVGTEFKLYFPNIEEPTPASTTSVAPLLNEKCAHETILVVEDEEPLRRLTRRILESSGYTVRDAPDGDTAIHVMAKSPTRVNLVLTDVVMPGMSGRELVERLLPVYPGLRVLFMSGYTEDTMLQHRVAELGVTVLEKPFTRDDLIRAVRNTLDRVAEPTFPAVQS